MPCPSTLNYFGESNRENLGPKNQRESAVNSTHELYSNPRVDVFFFFSPVTHVGTVEQVYMNLYKTCT